MIAFTFVVDEFSSDGLQKSEIAEIQEILLNGKVSITLIPQSVEIERNFHVDGKKIWEYRNWFQFISLKTCVLKETMRNTNLITALLKHSQLSIQRTANIVKIPKELAFERPSHNNYPKSPHESEKEPSLIFKSKDVFKRPKEKKRIFLERRNFPEGRISTQSNLRDKEIKLKSSENSPARFDNTNKASNDVKANFVVAFDDEDKASKDLKKNTKAGFVEIDKLRKDVKHNTETSLVDADKTSNSVEKITDESSVDKKKVSKSIEENTEVFFVDVDKASKSIEKKAVESKHAATMETSYKFHQIVNGHGVTGTAPVLVNLPRKLEDLSDEDSALVLSLVLENICLQSAMETILTCNDIEEARMLSYALKCLSNVSFQCYFPQFQGIFPSVREKQLIIDQFTGVDDDQCLSRIILSDNSGVKGFEARRVIMLVQPAEKILRHLFIEVLSRANLQLFVIAFPTTELNAAHACLKDVLEDLVNKSLFDVTNVELQEDYRSFDMVKNHNNTLTVNLAILQNKQNQQSFEEHVKQFDKKYPVKINHTNIRFVKHFKEFYMLFKTK